MFFVVPNHRAQRDLKRLANYFEPLDFCNEEEPKTGD